MAVAVVAGGTALEVAVVTAVAGEGEKSAVSLEAAVVAGEPW